MKPALVFFLLIGTLPCEANAQCTGAAGENKVICDENYDGNTRIGDTISPSWGVGPYSYSWSCMDSLSKNLKWTASDFLDDTTSPNPRILRANSALPITLTITDSLGNSCSDTVVIKAGGGYIYLFWFPNWAGITQGDSVRLGTDLAGGIRPVNYTWTPFAGLTDPYDENTWAKPDSTTVYTLEMRDSAGCPAYWTFTVAVWPVSVPENAVVHFSISPNPMKESTRILLTGNGPAARVLVLYDATGRKVREETLLETETLFYRDNLKSGMYYYRLFENGIPAGNGKLEVY